MEFLTYNRESGFNIVEASDMQSAEMYAGQDSVCLNSTDEVDEQIVDRIRCLLE